MTNKIYYCPRCGNKNCEAGVRQPHKGIPLLITHARCLGCGYGGQRVIQ